MPMDARSSPEAAIWSSPMNERRLMRVGVVGTVVAAICCFTPVLVVLLGAIGLAGAVGLLDYVLFPSLALFLGILVYALWKRRTARSTRSN